MSDEEKAALEAKQAEDEAKAKSDATDEQSDSEANDGTEDDSAQLKAELERERTARKKAEEAAAENAFKLREKKRKQEEENEEVEEDEKPLTASSLQAILSKEREATRKELQSERIAQIAGDLTSNDVEKELLVERFKNRSFPSHLSLEEQMEECYAGMFSKKLVGERNEALRALKGKEGVSRNTTSHHDAPTTQPKVAADLASEMARVGFKWNTTSRRYEKKLSNGQLLVKDQKTGATSLVKA